MAMFLHFHPALRRVFFCALLGVVVPVAVVESLTGQEVPPASTSAVADSGISATETALPHPFEPHFHTFSIAAIDAETGEAGVAVTTRRACVGNAVPWVRAGVGAVATQSFTRMEYGPELLDLLEEGMAPTEALRQRVEADEGRERRQVGVIDLQGRGAQHTGSEASEWAGEQSGPSHVTQGNLLVGPEVVEAVARTFEASEGSGRHLADRLVEALEAGQAAGGDARRGLLQSAALLVADPREDVATRPDQVSINLNICEHPEPVDELRRQYMTVSGTLGFRSLEQFSGPDVGQLRTLLHALGHYRDSDDELEGNHESAVFTPSLAESVDDFRAARGLSTPEVGSPSGWVDDELVEHLWAAVEEAGLTLELREQLRELTRIRR
jgi:uncharacterized Ntn-hydrolase superfamily protein